MKKTKANASIWDLLVCSYSHRKALVDALSKIQVSEDVSPENMVGLMMDRKSGEITFTNEDLPLEGRDHNKALYIAAEVMGREPFVLWWMTDLPSMFVHPYSYLSLVFLLLICNHLTW